MTNHPASSWIQQSTKINPDLRQQVWDLEAVHAWLARFLEWQPQSSKLKEVLSGSELERMGKFKSPDLAERYAIGRGLLRVLLGSYLDLSAEKVQLVTDPNGKPGLPNHTTGGLTFNLAHTDDQILFGFANNRPIGIDIERILPGPLSAQEIRRVLSEAEMSSWENFSDSEQVTAFYQTWVRKEAVLKALGTGLSFEPASLTVGFAPYIPLLRIESSPLVVKDLNIDQSTMAAIALVDTNMPKVCCFSVSN